MGLDADGFGIVGIEVTERDRFADRTVYRAYLQFQMPLFKDSAVDHREMAVEQRFRKILSPGPAGAQLASAVERKLVRMYFPIGVDHAHRIVQRHPTRDFLGKCSREFRITLDAKRDSRGHGVTAKLVDQARSSSGDSIQHVANVDSRHGARGTLERAFIGTRHRDHRPMHAVFHSGSNQADHALVPRLFEKT